jgi:hypothetical protein
MAPENQIRWLDDGEREFKHFNFQEIREPVG